jgi:CRISPR-associated endonuclease Cas2
MKNYGEPVQDSVFEFDLTPKQRDSMIKVIKSRIDVDEDRVRTYEFCGGCTEKVVVLGQGQELQRKKETLFV